jgi:hypothetical protein
MKRRKILAFISFIIILSCLLLSCSSLSYPFISAPSSDSATQSQKIELLESQISLLIQTQNLSKEENARKLEELKAEIEALKSEMESSNPEASLPAMKDEAVSEDTEQETTSLFTYTINGSEATITGYAGSDETLVIPKSIDGYTVVEISDSAISSSSIKNIIISESVTKIGWFAFSECTKLKSITIPTSVTNIGYSAFGSSYRSLVIYCHENSFARSYAESYGISYVIL